MLFYVFEQAHFVCLVACCLFLFVKLLVCFCKAKNIVIYLFIHTIQLTFSILKLHPFFLCVLPSLQFEKLKYYPIMLMLDWFNA